MSHPISQLTSSHTPVVPFIHGYSNLPNCLPTLNQRWPPNSTTSFSEGVVVAGTSYQILEVLKSFCNRKRGKPSPIKIIVLTFQVKNSTIMKLSELNIFDNTPKNFKSNLVLLVILVLKSKAI